MYPVYRKTGMLINTAKFSSIVKIFGNDFLYDIHEKHGIFSCIDHKPILYMYIGHFDQVLLNCK